MARTPDIQLIQEIPANRELPLHYLVKQDIATQTGQLGYRDIPTQRVPFTFTQIQDLLERHNFPGIPAATRDDLRLEPIGFQLIYHPDASSFLFVGRQDHPSDQHLPYDLATVTIEVQRSYTNGNRTLLFPTDLRLGARNPDSQRPIGQACTFNHL